MTNIEVSDFGKDFKGNKLNEDNCKGFQPILYKGHLYRSGNRRHFSVELYNIWGNFYMTVNMRWVRLVDTKFKY